MVNVAVTAHGIQVTPKAVGVPGVVPVRVNQNLRAPVNQADHKAPAVVQVTIANLTSRNTKLFLEGPKSASEVIPAQGSGSFNRALPNGIYRFSSPASTGTARFAVGPSRVSSSGDVLTP